VDLARLLSSAEALLLLTLLLFLLSEITEVTGNKLLAFLVFIFDLALVVTLVSLARLVLQV